MQTDLSAPSGSGGAAYTIWFHNANPVRVGVYQRRPPRCEYGYSKWDGEKWLKFFVKAEDAEKSTSASMWQDWEWRGLAQDPGLYDSES